MWDWRNFRVCDGDFGENREEQRFGERV